jgi:hypothetical protein
VQHIYAIRNKARRIGRNGKGLWNVLVQVMQEDVHEKGRNRMSELRFAENKTEGTINNNQVLTIFFSINPFTRFLHLNSASLSGI